DYPPDRPSASGSGYAAAAPRRLSRPRNGQALRLPDQRLSPFGQNHRRAVQRALANRAVLQVDQTEPEDQSLCRDEPQRRNDPDLDRVVRQPLGGLFEVHQPVCVLRAAAPASAAAQPLCETKPLRTPLSTATAISPPEATPAGAALNLWDISGLTPIFLFSVARILLPPPAHDSTEGSPMAQSLQGKRVAMLVENGFEQVELTEPRKALEEAGAETEVVSPVKGKVKGWNFKDWGDEVPVDT